MDTQSSPSASPRIIALTAAGRPLPRSFAYLVAALREAGAEVVPLPLPSSAPEVVDSAAPSFADLKRLARDLMSGRRREEDAGRADWLRSKLREVEGRVDALVAVDPDIALAAFPRARELWPEAVCVAIDGDYHLEDAWQEVPFDDLIVPDPMLAAALPRIREGRARVRDGGPLVGGTTIAPKRLGDDGRPQIVVSFARLEAGDVDPLLFQLSLANPQRFHLLFIASGRTGIDELVRTRAGGYGLAGKRARAGADPEPWIRGAAVLVGHPAPEEAAAAVVAGVPQLIFAPESRLSAGDRFVVDHGAAVHTEVPLTLSVQLEGLLPGGADHARAISALAELAPGGPPSAARALLDAISAGRPAAHVALDAEPASSAGSRPFDDELEDIGGDPLPGGGRPTTMPLKLRRAYLREIILKQSALEKQLTRATAGLATWERRVQLAHAAGDAALAAKARPRVEGLRRVAARLEVERRELEALHKRFAGTKPLSADDRAAASRLMSPEAAARLDRGEAPDSAFTQLEIKDALEALKRKLGS